MSYPDLLKRFLSYVKVNTRSDASSHSTPSTQSQVDFALTILKPEMEKIGLQDVHPMVILSAPCQQILNVFRIKLALFHI